MKNLLKAISYKKKYSKVAGQLIELLAERDALQEEIRELRFQNISLELEVKRQRKLYETAFQAGVIIAQQVYGLKRENTALKVRNNIIEHREVIRNESRTQSNDCGA